MSTSTFTPVAKRWLTRAEAAEYVGLSIGRLANLASERSGPPFSKVGGIGRPLYKIADLDRWIQGED